MPSDSEVGPARDPGPDTRITEPLSALVPRADSTADRTARVLRDSTPTAMSENGQRRAAPGPMLRRVEEIMAVTLRRTTVDTPLGALVLIERTARLIIVDWADCAARTSALLGRAFPAGYTLHEERAQSELGAAFSAYFAGQLGALRALPIEPVGSAFELSVWRALRTLGPGNTQSYAALAAQLGRPSAARAVGRANGQNPLSLVVPCHRVIGASGALTGYAGGLARKRWLLDHEARHAGARWARA